MEDHLEKPDVSVWAHEEKEDKITLSRSDFNELREYLEHDSWRCQYHQKCHCGLDVLTDKIGIERIPVPGKV